MISRHHIQFLQKCIQQDHLEQAIEYMNDINDGLDNILIKKYCTNEAVNLILSSYMEQADEQQIATTNFRYRHRLFQISDP